MSTLRYFLAVALLSAGSSLTGAGADITADYSPTTRTLNVVGNERDNRIGISRTADGDLLINNGEVAIAGSSRSPATVSNTDRIIVHAGDGNDTVFLDEALGALPSAHLFGGSGSDLLIGGSGRDLLEGEEGDDELQGRGEDDGLFGGSGNDVLLGDRGSDEMLGQDGTDLLIWNEGDGSDFMEGGEGFDIVQVNGSNTDGDDFSIEPNGERVRFQRHNLGLFTLDIGTTETLDINCLGGNDRVTGSTGLAGLTSLDIDGGVGSDMLTGGDGDDHIEGGAGNDVIFGGLGQDDLIGGSSDFFEDEDDDQLFGGDGVDVLRGGAGNDVLIGGRGNDQLYGEEGDDSLTGDEGDDLLDGGDGDDVVIGGWGHDWISGGTGRDIALSLPPTELVFSDGNRNGQIDPDECVELDVPVAMVSGVALNGLEGILDSLTPGVVVTRGLAAYSDLDSSAAGVNRTPFGLLTLPGLPCGEPVQLRLTLRTSEGRSIPVFFRLPTGPDCTPGGGGQSPALEVPGSLAKATERLNRVLSGDVPPSLAGEQALCSSPVAVPSPGVRYQVHEFTNSGPRAPVSIVLSPGCLNGLGLYAAAYLNESSPEDPCLSLLGEMGRDGDRTMPNSFSFSVPAGAKFQVVVHEVIPDADCEAYTLQVFGLPQPAPQLRITRLPADNQVLLSWSAPMDLYAIEHSTSLGPNSSFASLEFPIQESNGECSVAIPCQGTVEYFRLVRH